MRHLLSTYYVKPGMWEIRYEGDEEYVYISPHGRTFIDTNVFFDFDFHYPYGFIVADEFADAGLSLESLMTERGKEIRISFKRPHDADEWIRVQRGACLGFLFPTTFL